MTRFPFIFNNNNNELYFNLPSPRRKLHEKLMLMLVTAVHKLKLFSFFSTSLHLLFLAKYLFFLVLSKKKATKLHQKGN